MCSAIGRVVVATVVDHIDGNSATSEGYRDDNYASLCASHHAQKTASCDGAFGNRKGKMRVAIGVDGYPVTWDKAGGSVESPDGS
jgi:hypothetical protein